ncbi:hypothetical protein IIB34_05870 [PVC group bacterium]|nr:hypothetical protein [PVC group bacterium]
MPVDRPFQNDSCGLFTTSDGITYSCFWSWGLDPLLKATFDPRPVNNATAYELWLDEVLPIIEANPYTKPEAEPDSVLIGTEEGDETPTGPLEDLDPEVRKALDKLGICQFGEGVWAGIVSNYTREVPEELPIFTSGLDKRHVLGALARNFEECRGMTEYPWLSVQYLNSYLADQLGLDYLGRGNLARGNEPSLGFAETKSASIEDKKAEADKWREWSCNAQNLHLKLCNAYLPRTGDNRGGYTAGTECQTFGQPATEDGTSSRERCPMKEYIAFQSADPTAGDIHRAIQQAICDEYETQYEYLEIDKRPGWLSHCYNE